MTRASDGELVGWTVSDMARDDGELVDAVNPVGHVIAEDVQLEAAIDVLEARGLSSLSVPYWARAPLPLVGELDLRRATPEWQWRRMVMTQLDDTKVWIRPAYPSYPERMVELAVPLPADDVLVPEPPTRDE
ncbi:MULTISPECIES: hypothetical protein [unclassified Rhodococcus (in: high G+C Gram-positive bacteria)]|uniref:hypothetical protein n=1 Tax=unclassified Rhodococcus (in: high G+C Gram-positive bacteria) TaxID=192944 RepID=UPI000A66CC84|nr:MULTISPECIES: hypothetical protein [unclassified Rhodococcus (in: high G+C Gram-positive bacteria)]